MVKTAALESLLFCPVNSGRLEKRSSTVDIGSYKPQRILNRIVDVALGSKVDDAVNIKRVENIIN